MTRLSQILAVEQGAKADADTARDQAKRMLHPGDAKKMTGMEKTYRPYADDPKPSDMLPPESVKVQYSAEQVLQRLASQWAKMWDVTATVENGNAEARGTVVLPDGTAILKDMPVTFLLGLEKRLVEFGKVLDNLPAYDPARDWEESEFGIYKSPIVETMRPTRVTKVITLAPPDAHGNPAQVNLVPSDEPHGVWSATHYTGAMSPARIRELKQRQETLLRAVKFARHEANSAEVRDRHPGKVITAYLLG